MRFTRRTFLTTVLCIAFMHGAWGQQFYRSKGLRIFNQKDYRAAADTILAWALDHESETGIAYHYAGESEYNLAFEMKDLASIRGCFQRAARYFETALAQTDLNTLYAERKQETTYKLAWAYYRLSELDADQAQSLKNAFDRFLETSSVSNDSLKCISKFMAADCQLRRAQILRWQAVGSENAGSRLNLYQESMQNLDQAVAALESIQPADAPMSLQVPLFFRACDAQFELGQLYQKMPAAVFTQITDDRKKGTPEATAEAIYRSQAKFLSFLSTVPWTVREPFQGPVWYSEAVKRLNLFMISASDQDRQSLNSILDSLGRAVYPAEKSMIQGFAALMSDVKSDAFLRLADPQSSPFAAAASGISDAWFWFGTAQYLANDPKSIDSFERFLRDTEAQTGRMHMRILRDEANYLVYLIRFDRFNKNRDVLIKLKKDLDAFQPQESSLKNRSLLLQKLVRLSLGEAVWGKILDASSTEERFQDAFTMVQDALMRATQVTGKTRVPYLGLLDELFKITQYKKPEETAFYRGMAQFLKAEIQESAQRKRELYRSAAETMRPVNGVYSDEAKYIQARSIFAGAKHGSRSLDDYEQAKPLFIDLVNRVRSLRSLFYLGEILRFQENDLAARQCYMTVMEKTKDQQDGLFWYRNAAAGLGLCRNRGDASALLAVKTDQVRYPESLLKNEEGETISLERFADYDFLRRQRHDEAIGMALRFGIQKRELYPSIHRIEASRYAVRDFNPVTSGIQDKLGALSSGLRLLVLTPAGLAGEVQVTLNGINLMKDSKGTYQKPSIALNETAEIRVAQEGCYPVIDNHTFTLPGTETVLISLTPKTKYVQRPETEKRENMVRFSKRSDWNAVFVGGGTPLLPPSALISDFENDVRFRDFTYSEVHNGFLAVHARRENPIFYRNGSRVEWPLHYPKGQKKIQSAEGIAVDSKGNVFIVDWKGACVFAFDSKGGFIHAFGSFGKNTASPVPKPAVFEFPMRIALIEDRQGVLIDGQKWFRPIQFFITDQNGVQWIDGQGAYLDSLVPQGFVKGSLSSIASSLSDRGMQIIVYNQHSRSTLSFESLHP
jgi:hypothetical protein